MGKPRPRPKYLAAKLVQIRKALAHNQADMIERLNYEGELTQGMISNFETGKREPPLPLLLRYARTAGVTVEALIDDEIELKLPKY